MLWLVVTLTCQCFYDCDEDESENFQIAQKGDGDKRSVRSVRVRKAFAEPLPGVAVIRP